MRLSRCLLLLAMVGCAHTVVDLSADGVHYRIEGTSVDLSTAPGGVLVRKDGHELRCAAGRLVLDGRDIGPVVAGDRILFARDDRVSVNGAERTAR